MKIYFGFDINTDDLEQLQEDFETVELVEVPWNEDNEELYEQVMVDTKELNILEFDEWLEPWLMNHELKRIDWKYFLTY